jgi:hypothetical protein
LWVCKLSGVLYVAAHKIENFDNYSYDIKDGKPLDDKWSLIIVIGQLLLSIPKDV